MNYKNITILTKDHRDLNPDDTKRYQAEAHLAHLAGNEGDVWVGDGWLIPTRSQDERATYTLIPAHD